MKVEILRLGPDEWAQIATTTLKYSMGITWPKDKTRAAFALVVQEQGTQEPYGYMSVVEFDSESVYLQHGGGFPATRGTTKALKTYLLMVNELKKQYKFLSTRICNRNIAMLKMAFVAGFIVTGTQLDHYGDLYLVLEARGNQ